MAPTWWIWEEYMRFLWVGFAGAIGAIARYSIGLTVDQSRFPWATMGINLSGAFLLAFFLAVALGHLPVSVMTPIAVGLIGGFTTFSTFAWEAFTMSRTGRPGPALIYLAVSVCGGLLAAWAGYSIGRAVH
ncbi:MAG TPA: CrcB family protein [Acidimicrobiia bacterium]|jgi:CrcB protein